MEQVKFLVENRAISYVDMGEDLASLFIPEVETPDTTQSTNTMMAALSRDRTYIQTPSKSGETDFKRLLGEPTWDTV